MILLIDNYDSFTYNLYQITGSVNPNIKVILNDEYTVSEIIDMKPSHIMISPGSGRPKNAGICNQLIKTMAGQLPILGICLGHQSICETFGATVGYAGNIIHGKQSMIHIANGNQLFRGLPPLLKAGRYHSLAVERQTLPDELLVIAETDEGEVMGIKHREFDLYGIQFHPESILTSNGSKVIENFLQITDRRQDI